MPNHPLAEVFGFPANNLSDQARRHRDLKLCPFNNRVPNCTKDRATDPLGVCSIFDGNAITITCPVRFRQDWLIAEDAARFFFPQAAKWTSLSEIRLNDKNGNSAGNIDHVLVAYDDHGQVMDFGSLEVQAVYVSGNIRRPFEAYMRSPATNHDMNWLQQTNYPRADYLSSSRKRLLPQLIYKGGILHYWGKKQAVAVHRSFYETLPPFEETGATQAEIAWLVYDLTLSPAQNIYQLTPYRTVYTLFQETLNRIATPEPGAIETFMSLLQTRLDAKLDGDDNPPDAPTLADLL